MSRAGAAFLIAALGLFSSHAGAQAPVWLDCVGPFSQQADEAAVIAAFGRANVQRGDVYVGEGQSERGTLVFPGDPKRRIEILWHNADGHRRPAMIRVGAGSTWRVPGPAEQPVVVGMPLADVEKLNAKPFSMSGFDWDYGGQVTDWKGGSLAKRPAGCFLGVQFARDPDAGDRAASRAAGDATFASSSPAMRAVKPVIERMTLGWPN